MMDDATPTPAAVPAKPVAFTFQHKALAMEGSAFVLPTGSDKPVLKVDFGDVRGSIPLSAVRPTLGIAADSEDARLIGLVERSLRFVRIIRHGDKIPSEILDGSASWRVEERHRDLAWLKLSTTLLAQLGVEGMVVGETEQARTNLKKSADVLAGRLGIPVERRQDVLDRVELLANELGYIESLREFYKPLFDIPRKLREIAKLAARDPELSYDIKRAIELVGVPIGHMRSTFDGLDEKLADMVEALKSIDKTLKLIRGRRDALHFQSFDWSDVLSTWQHLRTGDDDAPGAVGKLCRFLIPRFMKTKVWAGG